MTEGEYHTDTNTTDFLFLSRKKKRPRQLVSGVANPSPVPALTALNSFNC